MSGAGAVSALRRPGQVAGLMLCVVAIALEAIAVVTAMPAAAADLGDLSLYAWAFTTFMIAQVFAIVAAGRASDRHGPRGPLVVGFIVFALGLLVAGSAPTMLILVAGRFIQGLGGGTMNLAVMVLIAVAGWLPGRLAWLLILGWVIGGLGMGMHMASTSLVVMELSAEHELGRNTSSLQVSEALGNSVAAGIAGTIFAAALANQTLAFGSLLSAMAGLALLGLAFSVRIGPVANHSLDNISTSR